MKLVEAIINGKYDLANNMMAEQFRIILERKMCETKKMVAAEMCGCGAPEFVKTKNQKLVSMDVLEDADNLEEARINLIKVRIRGGKVQRRKKVSNVPGMRLQGGQLKRMSAAERRARKLGAKRAKIKIRSKKTQMLRKRRLSLQKRQRLGL